MTDSRSAPKAVYSLVSLGCPKNLVDSERMAGLLQADGYRMVAEPEGADFVVVNTCGFLKVAREESLAVIREMAKLKKKGKIGGIIVAGCLAQRDREQLLEACPAIDRIVGVFSRDEIVAAADQLIGRLQEQRIFFRPAPTHALSDLNRLRLTPQHLAYLKIAEGCDRRCTFCSIPNIRGPHVGKPLDAVVDEAKQLVDDGVRELILVAQDTTFYGIDQGGKPQLDRLLTELNKIAGLDWIRVMYLYPMHFTEGLFDVLASGGKILPYLDIPLQHINDEILHRMNRRVDRAQTEALIDRLRERIPNLVLRTTMITGFPGETDEQFEELVEFVQSRRFERLGAFAFSPEEDTPASKMPHQVSPKVAASRRDALLAAQQNIAFAWNRMQVGKTLDILLDGYIPGEDNAFIGRSYADAPEIDGAVYVTGEGIEPGRLVPCEVVAVQGYDLVAAAVGPAR